MAAPHELRRRRRDHAHAILVVLGLFGDPDNHDGLLIKTEESLMRKTAPLDFANSTPCKIARLDLTVEHAQNYSIAR